MLHNTNAANVELPRYPRKEINDTKATPNSRAMQKLSLKVRRGKNDDLPQMS